MLSHRLGKINKIDKSLSKLNVHERGSKFTKLDIRIDTGDFQRVNKPLNTREIDTF